MKQHVKLTLDLDYNFDSIDELTNFRKMIIETSDIIDKMIFMMSKNDYLVDKRIKTELSE